MPDFIIVPRGSTRPRIEVAPSDDGYFPGQVARVLGLSGTTYGSLRRLHMLSARWSDGRLPQRRTWSVFTFAQLVAARQAVRLSGGSRHLSEGGRLRTRAINAACRALVELGVGSPLSTVRLDVLGRRIVARVQDGWFEPATGQLDLFGTAPTASMGGTGASLELVKRLRLDRVSQEEPQPIAVHGPVKLTR